MKQIIPAYYDQFHCLAEACPDSCCCLWEIAVDAETQQHYSAIPGELGQRLRSALTRDEDGVLILDMSNGACALWDADGLCAAQKMLGPEGVCKICREYPRMTQDYGVFVELDLELSCPEAARLILTSQPMPPRMLDVPGGTQPEYDPDLMALLLQSRTQMLQLLESEKRTLGESLAVVLLYACQVQSQIDGAEPRPFSTAAALQTARSLAKPADLAALAAFYGSLELLTADWKALLSQRPQPNPWTPELAAFARYELNRYWLHGVSDFDLVSRVKLVLAACLLLRHFGGRTQGEQLRSMELYSKEIDDCTENLDAILDSAYTHPALTDDRLLGGLLEDYR